MWEHQSLFRVSAQLFAEGIFNLLDRSLRPEVFLLGFASSKEADEPGAVIIEPSTMRYSPLDFKDVKGIAATLETDTGPQGIVYHLHPNDHDRTAKHHWYELVCRATETTLQDLATSRNENRRSFCAVPVSLQGYLVTVVLQLSTDCYDGYYTLPKSTAGRPVNLPHAA
ncbi:hypothetical protein [Hymenobacter glacialis]|uniref:Probable sensor domain-containing protein n=1 Tax=Hymenobacter glacialis TaxID=1908236 RepID=A0A1G1SRI4_9BACT|nr:hypothetical protein [Hymenobacter glacialis]OGX81246.1 hypothetical protein BEN48_06500 [Hymenobacter glacialis]